MFYNPSALKPSRNHPSLFAARRHRRGMIYTSIVHHTSSQVKGVKENGTIVWGQLVINSACNVYAYRLFPLRSAACWETKREEVRMKLDEPNHSVSIVITAPTSSRHFFSFALHGQHPVPSAGHLLLLLLFFLEPSREKKGRSSTATT